MICKLYVSSVWLNFGTGLYMHSAEVGLISAAGMQDTFSDLMGDGLAVMLWFRDHTWGSLVRGVNCAYVGVCARLSDRATSISFSDVMAPGNAPDTHAGIEIGEGSSAYISKWMALKGNATRVVGSGVVVNTDLAKVVDTLALVESDSLCEIGRSPCPAVMSCHGSSGCNAKKAGSSHSFGSFNDPGQTAAYGCALCLDDVEGGEALSVLGMADAICDAPSAQVNAGTIAHHNPTTRRVQNLTIHAVLADIRATFSDQGMGSRVVWQVSTMGVQHEHGVPMQDNCLTRTSTPFTGPTIVEFRFCEWMKIECEHLRFTNG